MGVSTIYLILVGVTCFFVGMYWEKTRALSRLGIRVLLALNRLENMLKTVEYKLPEARTRYKKLEQASKQNVFALPTDEQIKNRWEAIEYMLTNAPHEKSWVLETFLSVIENYLLQVEKWGDAISYINCLYLKEINPPPA